jgi:hypothetical protein
MSASALTAGEVGTGSRVFLTRLLVAIASPGASSRSVEEGHQLGGAFPVAEVFREGLAEVALLQTGLAI